MRRPRRSRHQVLVDEARRDGLGSLPRGTRRLDHRAAGGVRCYLAPLDDVSGGEDELAVTDGGNGFFLGEEVANEGEYGVVGAEVLGGTAT